MINNANIWFSFKQNRASNRVIATNIILILLWELKFSTLQILLKSIVNFN